MQWRTAVDAEIFIQADVFIWSAEWIDYMRKPAAREEKSIKRRCYVSVVSNEFYCRRILAC